MVSEEKKEQPRELGDSILHLWYIIGILEGINERKLLPRDTFTRSVEYLRRLIDFFEKNPTQQLEAARKAVEALCDERFLAEEYGWDEAERDHYHATHWKQLLDALEVKPQKEKWGGTQEDE